MRPQSKPAGVATSPLITALAVAALAFAGLIVAAPDGVAQNTHNTGGLEGFWREPGGSVIHVAPCDANRREICAVLVHVRDNAPTQVDEKNPESSLRSRPLCNLRIGYGFQRTGANAADGGHLYDPKSGHTYSGSMTSSGDQLNLRGYIGLRMFGRSETWTRTKPTSCTQK